MAVGKKGFFQSWMLEESDLVQGAAKAFGERLISDQVKILQGAYKSLSLTYCVRHKLEIN